MPHAPLLLPELESPEVAAAASTIRAAVRSLDLDVDALILLTPHSRTPGVYASVAGDLSGFGVPEIDAKAETDDEVAAALGLPMVESRIDHGVLVPLLLGGWDVPVVGVGVASDAAVNLETDRRVAVLGSLNLSAGLSPRAPLTEIAGATESESAFVEAVAKDVTAAAGMVPPGSCGGSVMATMGRLFGGRAARVLAHEAPVGVGYLVAEIA